MKINVEVINLDKVLKEIEDLLNEDIRNSKLMQEIGDFAKLRIQAETRRGNDLTQGLNVKQPMLSAFTVKVRSFVAQGKIRPGSKYYFKPDGTFFHPSMSNLTASGQMLESLQSKVLKTGEVIVEPTGIRDDYGGVDSEIKTNKDLANDLASRGRTFLGLDEKGIKRIKKMILDEVRRFKRRRGFR